MSAPHGEPDSRKVPLRRPWIILTLLLLLTRAPRLLAAGANNLAARALLPEWRAVQQEVALPRCETRVGTSAAEPYLALARRWDPASQRARLNGGRAAWLAGDCATAWASWEQALAADPSDQIAALWLLWASGADAGSLPGRFPAVALSRYADLAARRAGTTRQGAATWYELSLALAPGREAADGLAGLYLQAGEKERALAVWQRLAEALPEGDAEHWWALGQAAELEGNWEHAARAYGQGAEVSAAPYELWMRQAGMFRRLGRASEQEAAYHHAILTCPDCLAPYLNLGHLWSQHGQYEGALDWYVEAGRIAPRDARPPYHRAQMLHRAGESVLAIEALAQAIALHRGQPWQWAVQLGDWRLELGDTEGALATYHQALEWKPGTAAIQEQIERATR